VHNFLAGLFFVGFFVVEAGFLVFDFFFFFNRLPALKMQAKTPLCLCSILAWLRFLSVLQFGPDSPGLMYKVQYMLLRLFTASLPTSAFQKKQIQHCHLY